MLAMSKWVIFKLTFIDVDFLAGRGPRVTKPNQSELRTMAEAGIGTLILTCLC